MATLGMRYFNVSPPRQDPGSPCSGGISIFADRPRRGEKLTVYGEGGQSRDLIHFIDVVRANVAALNSDAVGVCNVSTGCRTSLLELIDTLASIHGRPPTITFAPARPGDIRDSLAKPERVATLGVSAFVQLTTGLRKLVECKDQL